jgi:hypothetical protein
VSEGWIWFFGAVVFLLAIVLYYKLSSRILEPSTPGEFSFVGVVLRVVAAMILYFLFFYGGSFFTHGK